MRSRADKLGNKAAAWESNADLEPAVARRLGELPASFTVLHDIRLPGTDARLDHLVISSGGVYLVDAKRQSGHLVYSNKMLWHGRFPIADRLESVTWEAESLSAVLGREVVPVMCFVDAVLPQPVTTLGKVIVCRVSVLQTIVRATHATMSAAELARVLEVASGIATSGRSPLSSPTPEPPGMMPAVAPTGVVRAVPTDAQTGVPSDSPTGVGRRPVGPTDDLTDDEFWAGPAVAAAAAAARTSTPAGSGDAPDPTAVVPAVAAPPVTGQTSAISTIPPIAGPGAGPTKEPVDRRWPRRTVFAILAVALVTAVAVIVWRVSRSAEDNRIEAEKSALTSTTTTVATKGTGDDDEDGSTSSTDAATTTTVLDVTRAGFSVTCPVPGAGWSLRPVWPGNQDGLAWYDFSYMLFDASFKQFAIMTAPEFTQYEPTQVPNGETRTVRIIAVYSDGRVGEPVTTPWTAPADGC